MEFTGAVNPNFDARNFLVEPEIFSQVNLSASTNYFTAEEGFIYEGIWMGVEARLGAGEAMFGFGPALLFGGVGLGLGDAGVNYTAAGDYRIGMQLNGMLWGQHMNANAIGYEASSITGNPDLHLWVLHRKYRI